MAGGYGVSSALDGSKWLINTVWWPGSLTEDETFLWYRVDSRLTVGTAYLLKQSAFRALGSYLLSPETATLPSTHVSAGVQGVGTGNPGYSFTGEKNWNVNGTGLNVFLGLGYRTNRDIVRAVGGFKVSRQWLTVGYQNDGVEQYPFVTASSGRWSTGAYLINFKSPAFILGTRF